MRTRKVLKGAASLSAELQKFTQSCFGEISRVASHLNLAYHQVSLRPFSQDVRYGLNHAVHPCDLEARPVSCVQKTPRDFPVDASSGNFFNDERSHPSLY